MTEQTLTLDPATLKELLSKVLPFAGTDAFFPLLASVHFELRDGILTASATDRYKMGIAKTTLAGEPFAATIPVDICKQLLRFYPVARRVKPIPVVLTVTDGLLTASQPGAAVGITCTAKLAEGQYPDLAKALRKRLAANVSPEPSGYNARDLLAFSHLGEVALVPTGVAKMTLVYAHDFVGAVMALGRKGGSSDNSAEYAKKAASEWASLFAAETEDVAA